MFASPTSAPAYDYDPYGVPLQGTAPLTDFGYAGMFYNPDSGLYLTLYRAYDPVAGRWLSRDPIGELGDRTVGAAPRAWYYSPASGRLVAGNTISLEGGINQYAYGLGSPVSFADPYGLDVFICSQPAFGWMPVDHEWIKTDTVEAGMGGTRGNEPGNQYGDYPGDPVQVVDHSGRSTKRDASCEKVEGVDEQMVNDQLKIGRQLGRWGLHNQCSSFVSQVLHSARRAVRRHHKEGKDAKWLRLSSELSCL